MSIGARKEDHVSDPAGVEALMRTSRLMTAVVARSLVDAKDAPPTLTPPQLRVLVLLSSGGPSNLTVLAGRLGVNASNASRVSDRLVTTDLITRSESPDDRRQVVLALSERGRQLVEGLMARRRKLFVEVTAAMSTEDRQRLRHGLTAFLAAADEVAEFDDLLAPSLAADGLFDWLA